MPRQLMRPIVGGTLLLAALASAGCKTMRSVTLDQLTVMGADRVWVTARDQSVVLMWEPKVVGDTLVGYVGKRRERLASADLTQLRVRMSAHARTALLAVGATAGLVGLLVVAAGSGQTQAQTTTISGAPGDCSKHPDLPPCDGN
jgi:hypothetical protein